MSRAGNELDVPPSVPLFMLKSTVLFPLQVASVQISTQPNQRLLTRHPDPREIVGIGVFVDPEGPYLRRNLGSVAVAGRVLSRIETGRGRLQIVLQGLRRIRIRKLLSARPFFRAEVEPLENAGESGAAVKERVAAVIELVEELVRIDGRYPDELLHVARLNRSDAARCADTIADAVQFSYDEKRKLLELSDVSERLSLLSELLQREVARSDVVREVRAKTARSIDRSHREAFLREQLAVIRRELEEMDPAEAAITELAERVRRSPVPPPVAEEARRDIHALRDSGARAREGSAIRTFIDWALSMPWDRTTTDRLDLRRARRMLDERYFGLGSARDRLLEYLAVRKLGGHLRAPLLAIVGPPGTGRTSLANTVARVLGRQFVHLSAHGITDESEIRGIRRTEGGARPGRILEGLRAVGVRNPVILIDHVDRLEKAGQEPLAAVLEVLDPTRNSRFRDDYLGVPFDLSPVLFVITANVEDDIPEALWPVMYTIELTGYTDPVKLQIARKYIWPEALDEHGLVDMGLQLTNGALRNVIRDYTQEAGVRELKEQLQAICRRAAVRVATRGRRPLTIDTHNLERYLGKPIYPDKQVERKPAVGLVTGLAWTDAGGDLLPIEALLMPGDGYIMLTGLLGEVMEESVEAALSYVRSRSEDLGIPDDILKEKDLHIHFPEGSIAKDGPSAGIAVAAAIASLLSNRPVRPDIAMTGEISLQGRVLPVGGIQEKVLAAYRAGLRRVILPKGNESDLAEVPREVRGKLRTRFVSEVAEVFRLALMRDGTSR